MNRFAIAAAMFLAATPVLADTAYTSYEKRIEEYPGSGQFPICKGKLSNMSSCVVDGDTVRIDYRSYRIGDLDTPETTFRAKCPAEKELGLKAKERAIELLNRAIIVRVTTYMHPLKHEETRDKYGRLLATIEADGVNLGEKLISEGLARHYDGTTKGSWCEAQ